MNQTWLVPVEIKARELKARTKVAARLVAAHGGRALIGPSRILHRRPELFPTGMILENDVTVASRAFCELAHRMGFTIAALDEEAIAVLSDDWYVRQRIDSGTLDTIDIMFTRGNGDRDAIAAKVPWAKERLCVAGNPRLDILHPKLRPLPRSVRQWPVDRPREILVVSRFSRSNGFSLQRHEVLAQVRRKFRFDEDATAFYAGYLEHCHKLFDAFIAMSDALAARFSACTVILRPHPSENVATWQEIVERHPNARVETSGTAEEWAEHTGIVVHNGCTSGLEAALLGCKVLAFQPFVSPTYDVELPNALSEPCGDTASLFDALSVHLAKGCDDDGHTRRAAAWTKLAEFVGAADDRSATNIIVEELGKISSRKRRLRMRSVMCRAREQARHVRDQLVGLGRSRGASGLDQPADAERRRRYHDQKFDGLTAAELVAVLDGLGEAGITVAPWRHGWWQLTASKS